MYYMVICVRPYFAFATWRLAQFFKNPASVYWNAVLHALKRIKGTINLGLCFLKTDEIYSFPYSIFDKTGYVGQKIYKWVYFCDSLKSNKLVLP